MKKICVVTGTRAEYHLLYPLIKKLMNSNGYEMKLVVTGSHLSEEYGETYKDIEADGVSIAYKIDILENDDSISGMNIAISRAILGFDQYIKNNDTDLMILLGDRYELLAAAIVAMNYCVPIAHISGGETTEGAIDEYIRHSITKMSAIHFPCCEAYRKRIIQMGESPDRVFNVGDLGVENTLSVERMTREELSESLEFDLTGRYVVVTFHPVTLEDNTALEQINELLHALDAFEDIKIVFTKSNADAGGRVINMAIDDYAKKRSNQCKAFFSLGLRRYLSAISMANAVIGNSSSGIVETPSFAVPTVNIGDRQRGRIQAKNILNCKPVYEDLVLTIKNALSEEFKKSVKDTVNPFGDGNCSKNIMDKLDYYFDNTDMFPIKKGFYDVNFEL